MLMNTTFLGDSFSIKWQSRVLTRVFHWLPQSYPHREATPYTAQEDPDFATCSILTIEKNVENTAFGLYFFNFML